MSAHLRVLILEDHYSTSDSYINHLKRDAAIEVAGVVRYGEDLLPALVKYAPVHVLLLDLEVKTSESNLNPYPLAGRLPYLRERFPDLKVLVITAHNTPALVRAMCKAGAHSYILKDDLKAYQELAEAVRKTASGLTYLSRQVEAHWHRLPGAQPENPLTDKELEILGLCAAYPNEDLAAIADRVHLAQVTVRVHLSNAYQKLGVKSRQAAVSEAQHRGWLFGTTTLNLDG